MSTHFVHYFKSKVGRGLILKYSVSLDCMPHKPVDAMKSNDDLAVAI